MARLQHVPTDCSPSKREQDIVIKQQTQFFKACEVLLLSIFLFEDVLAGKC